MRAGERCIFIMLKDLALLLPLLDALVMEVTAAFRFAESQLLHSRLKRLETDWAVSFDFLAFPLKQATEVKRVVAE
jgi:hypothetical protein